MCKFRLNALCFFSFIILQFIYASYDNQTWTKISFEKKIPLSLKLELSQGVRLKDYVSNINLGYFEMAVSYKDSSGLKVTIPYRYTVYENKVKHRISLGCSYQLSFKPFSVKYRLKFYKLFEDGDPLEETGIAFGNLFRNKFTTKYKLNKKLSPFVSGEIFHLFNAVQEPFNEYRVSVGCEINLKGKKTINLFYTYDKEDIFDLEPKQTNIFGFNYISKM